MRTYVRRTKYEQYFILSLLLGAQVMSERKHSACMACFQALLQCDYLMNMYEGGGFCFVFKINIFLFLEKKKKQTPAAFPWSASLALCTLLKYNAKDEKMYLPKPFLELFFMQHNSFQLYHVAVKWSCLF